MRTAIILMIVLILGACTDQTKPNRISTLNKETLNTINRIIRNQVKPIDQSNSGEIIKNVSAEFLAIPYAANTLVGSTTEPEKLVINFDGVDCFTYLDYVESFRKSNTVSDFVENLIKTRYVNAEVSYAQRKHFFTDWSSRTPLNAKDITAQISPHSILIHKELNKKSNGERFLPSIAVVNRDIVYIPTEFIDDSVINKLRTGDYIGSYTDIDGLDVTHTGIFIMTNQGPMLRNASSRAANKKVVDTPFMEYIRRVPGIIVLRAITT